MASRFSDWPFFISPASVLSNAGPYF